MKEGEFFNHIPDIEPGTFRPDETPEEESEASHVEPGTFSPDSPDDPTLMERLRNLKLSGQNADTVELASSERIVASLKLFTETFKPKTDLIYYPCCANDISPTLAFGDSRVVYVDISAPDVQALQEKGFEAHEASALEFNPGPVDILLIFNPTIDPTIPSSHVVEGGFVLSNDYHRTATQMHQNPAYEFKAIIRGQEADQVAIETENLADYWAEVETDEEFKNAEPSFFVQNYQSAALIVETLTGKREYILAEYKKLLASLQAEHDAQQKALYGDEAPLDREPELFTVLHNDIPLVLSKSLPKKKGQVDNTFVFQKKGVRE